MPERLQKILAGAGLCSRRTAEEYISAGRVTVNGAVAGLGDKADIETDTILFDGVELPRPDEKVYIMLNKPKGYVTSLSDEQGRQDVGELVKDAGVRLYPVGRLDLNSEGLLIMTNDGDFANLLMHPSHQVKKTYRTWVRGGDIEAAAALLRQSMEIDGYTVRPAEVRIVRAGEGGAILDISIREGRNRQVRKMCEMAQLRVTRLMRISEGKLTLGELPSGSWRHLTKEELGYFK